MADISKVTLPNGDEYNIKDSTARAANPTSATVSSTGLITFKNSGNTTLFTVQLPLYDGSVS